MKGKAPGVRAVPWRSALLADANRSEPLVKTDSNETQASRPQATFRQDIEGLRAVAVVSVVLFHAGVPGFGGGFVGVDVFFVISGYLITGQLAREHAAHGRVQILAFYARRARRLLPAATVTIVGTLVAALFLQSAVLQRVTGFDGLAASLFLANVRFLADATDYFASTRTPSPFLHFWSLAIEEQFYVVWPTLLVLAGLKTSAWGRRSVRVVLILSVLSFAACVYVTAVNQSVAYFSLPTRAWELGVGAALALGAGKTVNGCDRWIPLIGSAGMWSILGAVVLLSDERGFPGPTAAMPVAGAALIIYGGSRGDMGWVRRTLELRPFQWVGKYSYSLYLWHWPVLVLAASRYPTVATNWRKGLLVVACAALPLAVCSFHLIESPIRRGRRFKSNGAALRTGLALIAASVATVPVYLFLAPDRLDSGREVPAFTAEMVDSLQATEFVPSNLSPDLMTATKGVSAVGNGACIGDQKCWLGDPRSDRVVVLFGDSHAGHFASGFAAAAQLGEFKVLKMTAGGCGSFLYPPLGRSTTDCDGWRDRAFRDIERIRPDLVIFSNHSIPVFRGTRTSWERGVVEALERVPRGVAFAVIGQTPEANEDVPACLAKHLNAVERCEPPWPSPALSTLNARLRNITESAGGRFLDVNKWLCSDKRCPAIIGNLLVWRDANHLTRQYVSALAPRLEAFISGNDRSS